jgi:hypothetical protein
MDAIQAADQPHRDGPTAEQIGNRYRELESRMSDRDSRKLRCVSPYSAGEQASGSKPNAGRTAIGERRVRKWRSELLRKYGDGV